MSKFYDESYKWSLYEKYLSGFTLTDLCEISGISDKSLHEWFKWFDYEYAQASRTSLRTAQQSNARVKENIAQRQLELTLIQEIGIKTVPEVIRIFCAQRVLSQHGPNRVCRTLKIRKSNLYYHVFHKPKLTIYEKRDQEILPVIQKICEASPKRLGAERIRQQLMEQGFTVGKKKVLQLLREADLRYLPSNKRSTAHTSWKIDCVNLLARNFSPPHPNMVWLSDITEIKTDSGPYYLCVVLDLFARRIVSARLAIQKDAELVCRTFHDAFIARGFPKDLLFHSDQGTQYTGHKFRSLLYDCGVTQSFSAPGVPYDNAPMESFFASLKVEEVHRYRYHSISDLTVSLREYMDFYNRKRLHSSIDNQIPAQVEETYYKRQSAVSISTDCVPFACKK